MYYRLCYKGGIVKKGNELYEFHKLCDCEDCKNRFKYRNESINSITVTTDSKSKFDEIEKMLKDWKCKDGNRRLETEYMSIYKE